MGASGSAEQPDRRYGGNVGPGERLGQRVRRVRVTGAGMSQVNGVYLPMVDFAGGEAFELEVNQRGINKIYIRRRSEDARTSWVITLSPHTDVMGDHLYKRESETAYNEDQCTPPLFGWTACTADDGAPGRRANQLAQGVPKLKYHYGPLQDINWDCQPFPPGYLDRPNARGTRPGQQGFSSSLVVCVIGAKSIPETRAREFHVACQVPGKHEIIESVPVGASQDPVFKFKIPLQSWKQPDHLQFTLYADRNIKIGAAELDYSYFQDSGFVGEIPVSLFGSDDQEVSLSVCVTMPGQATPGIDVQIRKDHGSKMGIEVAPDSQSNCLVITKILEGGLFAQWNYENPDQQIGIRDKIVEIEGEAGSVRALLVKFARDEPRVMRMRIQRAGT